jgi:hypothetical protein
MTNSKNNTQIIISFHHKNHAFLMKDIYQKDKSKDSLNLSFQAFVKESIWKETFDKSKIQFHNYYQLSEKGNQWHCTPIFRTWTNQFIKRFTIDFTDSYCTVLNVVGNPKVADLPTFTEWFAYLKTNGVNEIKVKISA